ncbi:GIN domain-containing protein [Rhodohalobacter sp. 8-1]|uniref:GIN domain-containing protein n=1 Tax=Rhodohalobacter sp. 8-1 TaxID=3131972 RepID=UPI0030EDBAA3
MIRITLLLTTFLISLSGCIYTGSFAQQTIQGNSNIITETRDVGHFSELRITGSRSTVVYGDEDGPIRIKGDSNILENIESYIDGNRLVISSKDNTSLNPTARVEIEILSTRLNAVRVSGSNRIVLRNIDQELFAIRGSGSTAIEANGYADKVEIRMSGSSRINAPNLVSESAVIRTSGSSKAEVNVSGKLESRSSGSSEIIVHGNPVEISNQSSGSSRIRTVED